MDDLERGGGSGNLVLCSEPECARAGVGLLLYLEPGGLLLYVLELNRTSTSQRH
jgi:hypothetical protein